jgi:membrane protein involved in colicin uptake
MATAKVKSESKAPAAKKEKPKSAARPAAKKTASAKSSTTTNHDEIRAWVEKRKGTPSTVKGTENNNENSGILRIDFPGYSGKDSLEAISWEDFFKKFDESNLEFLYQEETSSGKPSRFNKFVSKK